jgi:ketosteroid isomerase-like protein
MQQYKFLLITVVIFISCQNNKGSDSEKLKKEIADAEKSFETMAAEKGIAEAFWFFADSNAVIKRQHDTLIQGRENIRKFYSAGFYTTASVKWSPDFIDVSSKGDLGYTYGKYIWQSKDSTGKAEEFRGVFHTVWKKQHDGTWKYVWD